MNIFVTDPDPIKSALALDDLRLNKMILESVQMLGAALAKYSCPTSEMPLKKDGGAFKGSGWQKHPCTVWVGDSRDNFIWLINHADAMITEMYRRRGTHHSMHRNISRLISASKYIPQQGLTDFVNCSLIKQDNIDVFESYKMTMIAKWSKDLRPPKWTNAIPPSWATGLLTHPMNQPTVGP